MYRLKKLALVAVLGATFAMPAAADEPSCAPGQTNTPPCASAQQPSEDFPTLDPASVPPNSDSDVWVTELAINVIQSVLTLF